MLHDRLVLYIICIKQQETRYQKNQEKKDRLYLIHGVDINFVFTLYVRTALILAVEGFLAERAHESPLSRVHRAVTEQRALGGEGLAAELAEVGAMLRDGVLRVLHQVAEHQHAVFTRVLRRVLRLALHDVRGGLVDHLLVRLCLAAAFAHHHAGRGAVHGGHLFQNQGVHFLTLSLAVEDGDGHVRLLVVHLGALHRVLVKVPAALRERVVVRTAARAVHFTGRTPLHADDFQRQVVAVVVLTRVLVMHVLVGAARPRQILRPVLPAVIGIVCGLVIAHSVRYFAGVFVHGLFLDFES